MAGEWPQVTVGELAESISDTHKMSKEHLVFLNTSDVLLGRVLHRTSLLSKLTGVGAVDWRFSGL